MDNQISIFDVLYPKYKITKPIRLIEFFAGYGSQSLALKYLGVPFEHWKICEWAVKSIQAYKDIHFTDDNEDYSKDLTKQDLEVWLSFKGISSNYNEPMNIKQIERLSEKQLRTIYNNNLATHNLVNIQQVKGEDLEIVDTDKYDYILTYSFPCQDLSLAGKGKGMSDTSTRSGMLWEVERILTECKELGQLPQILLMENVPQVHGTDNVQDFNKWQLRLEELGYKNYFQDLIATDYGIPQTRNRCFMISILGDYSYTFPQPVPLKLKLKDMLEDNVDEKYYLSDKMLNCFLSESEDSKFPRKERFMQTFNTTNEKGIAATITTAAGTRATDNFIKVKNATKKGYLEATDGDGVDISSRMEHHRGTVQKDKAQTLTTQCDRGVVVNMKTELCNNLIKDGKVKENDVIRHSYTTSRLNGDMKDLKQNNLSPTLDTRCDCLGVVIKNNNIYNLFFTIFDLCSIIDTKEKDKYERSRELLQILWQEIGKKEIWQEIRRFISIQEKEILQSNLYENGLYEDRKLQSRISSSTSNGKKYNEGIANREKMLNMWEDWKIRYTPQRWELPKQQFEQFNLFMQKLSYETTQGETSMQDMWQTNERFRVLQQTLFEIQEIWKPIDHKISSGLRIRKLSPRECWRLMGVKDEDYEKCAKNQSDSSLYHLAGDSIVVNVLMAIFKKLLESEVN